MLWPPEGGQGSTLGRNSTSGCRTNGCNKKASVEDTFSRFPPVSSVPYELPLSSCVERTTPLLPVLTIVARPRAVRPYLRVGVGGPQAPLEPIDHSTAGDPLLKQGNEKHRAIRGGLGLPRLSVLQNREIQ